MRLRQCRLKATTVFEEVCKVKLSERITEMTLKLVGTRFDLSVSHRRR